MGDMPYNGSKIATKYHHIIQNIHHSFVAILNQPNGKRQGSVGSGSLTTETAMLTDVTTTILKQIEFNLLEPLHIMNSNNIPETKTGFGSKNEAFRFKEIIELKLGKNNNEIGNTPVRLSSEYRRYCRIL